MTRYIGLAALLLTIGCGDDGGNSIPDAPVNPTFDAQSQADGSVPDASLPDAMVPRVSGPLFAYLVEDSTVATRVLYLGGLDNGSTLTPQRVHPPLEAGQVIGSFDVSADGKWIAYEVITGGGGGGKAQFLPKGGAVTDRALYLVAIDNATPGAPVTIVAPQTAGFSFTFTADSSRFVYVTDVATPGTYELYARDLASGTPGSEVTLSGTIAAGGGLTNVRVAPSGSTLLYTAYQDSTTVLDLFVVDAANPGTPVKVNGTMPDGAAVSAFSWAPDRSKLLYLADQATLGRREGWVADITGTTPSTAVRFNQPLTTFDAVESAQFSPDSANIVYAADHELDGARGFWRVDLSTGVGTPQRLSAAATQASFATISGDSAWVSFRTNNRPYVNSLTSPGTPSQIAIAGTFAQTDALFSGDGGLLSTRRNPTAGTPLELWVTEPGNPTGSTMVSDEGGVGVGIVDVAWAPAGRRVAYSWAVADPAGAAQLYLIDFSGTTPSTPMLISGGLSAGANGIVGPTWGSDGSSLTYLSDESTGAGRDLFWVDMSAATPGAPVRINATLTGSETVLYYLPVAAP